MQIRMTHPGGPYSHQDLTRLGRIDFDFLNGKVVDFARNGGFGLH
jgi:hypothetical protein